ncbi:MAG TPA: hypothetical protein VN613_11960 [Gemmatimonadaceae bacterium]|jgi:hypothetical protein|nr:hypothetical protein [Gemmatimonadaceae bacterium]HXD24064.1 hypothetical protein [Gemmatimonadaceae bacterium]
MIQEITTRHSPADVLARARTFFAQRNPLYGAFLEKEGPSHVTFRGQGGEEIVVGVTPVDGGTRVRASTYLYDAQISRFFTTLEPAPMVEDVIE